MITEVALPAPACRVWYARLVDARRTDVERQLAFYRRYSVRTDR